MAVPVRASTDRPLPLLLAAVIRALADWLVPEESSETFLPGEDSHNHSKLRYKDSRLLPWLILKYQILGMYLKHEKL